MTYGSYTFLLFFLPLFFAAYLGAPKKFRPPVLLVFSLAFTLWGSGYSLLFLITAIIFDQLAVGAITRSQNQRSRKSVFVFALVVQIGSLAYFKYTNFFVAELGGILDSFSLNRFEWPPVVATLGISFITFSRISYLVDIYRQKCEPAGWFSYSQYLSFFPKVSQGPIALYRNIADGFHYERPTRRLVADGVFRFGYGLAKKVLIADMIGRVADRVFGLGGADLSPTFAWLGAISYTFQIYFDFSAYTDMAIGVSRIIGVDIGENFNRPYISASVTEFWRRWHITLTDWFRQYLYIPLGGNRRGGFRTYLNLWIVFLLSGLWHGAAFTFIFWGAYHGFFLSIERLIKGRIKIPAPKFIKVAYAFIAVCVGWVFFRSADMTQAAAMLKAMAFAGNFAPENATVVFKNLCGNRELATLLFAALLSFAPAGPFRRFGQYLADVFDDDSRAILKLASVMALALFAALSITNNSYNPFIYVMF